MAQHDPKLKKIINSADLSIADGVGLKLADSSLEIIKGRELMADLINLNKYKVFLLGSKNGPTINSEGEPVSQRDRLIEIEVLKKINRENPDILFVGFGSPKEQKWIAKHLPELKIKMAMQVGGGIDYMRDHRKTPSFLERNFEWFWRLIKEPKRFRRIINATVIFPILLLSQARKGA
jgi:N-acetylglucosaminyldiphosphoundecaprenol N-acetyl-beta-D-mannosaminyltransferase